MEPVNERRRGIIYELLSEQQDCYRITKELLMGYFDGLFDSDKIVLSKEDLLVINKKYLSDCINENPAVEARHFNIFYSCICDIESASHKGILDGDSCRQMRDAIRNSPDWYIGNFVILGGTSNDPTFNWIGCEAYWRAIFGDPDSFRSFIYDNSLDSLERIIRVRNFWELYEKNDFSPIEINGEWDVQDLIDNDLKELMPYLSTLEGIEREYQGLKNAHDGKTMSPSDEENLIQSYRDLLYRFNENKLYIRYTQRLRADIQGAIDELGTSSV